MYYLKSIASSNLDFTGFVSDTELLRFIREPKCIVSYPDMKVYLILYVKQCCVDVYLSELTAIGDTGFYVPYCDVEATVEGIKKVLSSNAGRRESARARIKRMFSQQRREKELIHNINDLTRYSKQRKS